MARDLLISLDRQAPEPLRRQLEEGLRSAVLSGQLVAGTRLPATRALAADLGVSRRLVIEAYEQLVAEGYLESRVGSGTVVRPVSAVAAKRPPSRHARRFLWQHFRPGIPDTGLVGASRWIHHEREAFRQLGAEGLQYGDPAGYLPLRRALAAYLGRVRGVRATPESIVICPGFAGALTLLAAALSRRAVVAMAVEDPGSIEVYPLLRANGLEPCPIPVDVEGIGTSLPKNVGAALCTPAHQYPTGVVLSPGRRAALVEWAQRTGGYVIEDDYDAEFRYDRAPIGATQGLAPDRVIYAGSVSKTLAPALRLGWLVLPPELAELATGIRATTDLGNPTLPQAALALMLEAGDYDRHLRRARRLYRSRRDSLIEVLRGLGTPLEITGIAAGLHLVAGLPPGVTETAIIERGRRQGLELWGLERFRSHPSSEAQGLVLGYGALYGPRAEQALERLGVALRR